MLLFLLLLILDQTLSLWFSFSSQYTRPKEWFVSLSYTTTEEALNIGNPPRSLEMIKSPSVAQCLGWHGFLTAPSSAGSSDSCAVRAHCPLESLLEIWIKGPTTTYVPRADVTTHYTSRERKKGDITANHTVRSRGSGILVIGNATMR
ncbi:hypothetical protein F4775DRAFT_336022 [Biscogniauxia sp. FL1348]|nr:hypothetical protein F4775DRAFT_336022 [Biscogniauxia sp. FL1348]